MRLRLTWTRAGVVLAVLLLVAAGLVAWLNVAGEDPLVGDAGAFAATPEQVAHGAYLARAGNCAACHTDRGGAAFAGGKGIATPFGTVFASNLTPDAKTGIGAWSAAQFWRAMHNGRSADGRLLYPAFPYPNFTEITRADSDALFAYLRSQVPVTQVNRPHALRFPYNLQASLAVWRAMFFAPGVYEPVVERSVQWNRGAYLVRSLGHCAACHSPRNAFGATRDSLELSGGLIPLQNWYAPSLTSNKEAGLGDWDIKDIQDLLKNGVSQRGAVFGPMAEVVHNSLQYMSDEDINAMATYLKTIPQKSEAPEPLQLETSEKFGGELLKQGQKIYADNCAKCHAENGLGMPPSFPPLANNQSIQMPSAVNPIRMVLNGGYPPSTDANPHPYGMPPFAQALSNTEVAAVVTYIRMSWGNHGTAVSPQQVSDLRSAPLD